MFCFPDYLDFEFKQLFLDDIFLSAYALLMLAYARLQTYRVMGVNY